MSVRLSAVPPPRGLGVGMDLPWGAPAGFVADPARGDRVSDRVATFLRAHRDDFTAFFGSWQPRSRGVLDAREYFPAWDDLARHTEGWATRTLHQTAFNLGALDDYDRGPVVALTNALIDRYGLAWVNEDLGLWSLRGHALPYPLPPFLTAEGLAAATRNTSAVQGALRAPLVVEFPGFSAGAAVVVGRMHAYDFFRRLAEDTGSPVTLDVGHLLSYQWLRGRRGADLYAELDRLPLDHCVELHLSGCAVVRDGFVDAHHGVLLDEQFALLDRLLPRCPALRLVTYEDPRLTPEGALGAECRPGFARLQAMVAAWA